jgi:hypothetical protein
MPGTRRLNKTLTRKGGVSGQSQGLIRTSEFLYPPFLGDLGILRGSSKALAAALWLTLIPAAGARGRLDDESSDITVSAGPAAGGAPCTSVGARSMRNYLKF